MDDIHRSGVMTGLQNIWSSSQYWDIVVRSGSEEFKLHRAIICPRSKFFAAACNGTFQVCRNNIRSGRTWKFMLINVVQEGKTGIITLQDDDTPTVRRMLKYLYTLDYDDNGEATDMANYAHDNGASTDLQAPTLTEKQQLSVLDPPDYRKVLNNIAVYAIADKYDIPELEALAVTKFNHALWISRLGMNLANLPAIVDAVFDATPDGKRGLRDVMITYCKCWKKRITDNEDFAAIVTDHGEIGLAMIRELFHEQEQHEKSTEARIKAVRARENELISHIERISLVAKCMKVSDSREVQQNYIDAQHRRLKDLRDAIEAAKDYIRRG